MDYTVFVNLEVAESIRAVRGRHKRNILDFLKAVGRSSFTTGDLQTDRDGRMVQIKVFGPYSLAYWPDHAVKEVKVIDFYHA